MATQVVILRAVRDFVPHSARLKNATMAFYNGMLRHYQLLSIERLPAGKQADMPAAKHRDGQNRSPENPATT